MADCQQTEKAGAVMTCHFHLRLSLGSWEDNFDTSVNFRDIENQHGDYSIGMVLQTEGLYPGQLNTQEVWFSSSSIQGRFSQDVPLNCKVNKEACEYLQVISNVWTALQKNLLDLIFKTLVQ